MVFVNKAFTLKVWTGTVVPPLAECGDGGASLRRSGSAVLLRGAVLHRVQRSEVLQLSEAGGEDGHCYR